MKQKLTLNIQEELIEEIKVRAVREKLSLSALTEKLYQEYLDRQKEEKGKKAKH